MSNSILLDATMVRCSANRSSTKYEAECVNAREAINRLARVEEEARRAELEAQSERKRRALRRAQEAAAEARRRTAEAARRREEAAYLAQFENGPIIQGGGSAQPPGGSPPVSPDGNVAPAPVEPAGTTAAPDTSAQPEAAPPTGTDLESIREELRRRQDGNQ